MKMAKQTFPGRCKWGAFDGFTIHVICQLQKGNRPSFIEAGAPEQANELYEYMLKEAAKVVPVVQHGIFGADMKISLENDGPFTVMLDESIM